MKPNNLRKRERLFKQAFKKAEDREKKGFFEGAALAYLEASKLISGDELETRAFCLDKCGCCYDESGNYKLAKESYNGSLAIKEKISPSNLVSIADTLNDLGVVVLRMGEYEEAEHYYRRALAIRETSLGKYHQDTLQTLNNLSNVYYYNGKYKEAIETYKYVLDSQKNIFINDNLDIALTFYNLGNTFHAYGDCKKALEYSEKSLDIREKIHGSKHKLVADSLTVIGNIYLSNNNLEMAEKCHIRALNIIEKNLGNKHPDTMVSLNALGLICLKIDKYSQAEGYYEKSLIIGKEKLGEDHPRIIGQLINLGVIYYKKGDINKSEECYMKALHVAEKTLGEDHPRIGFIFNNLGEICSAKEKYDEAEIYFSRARDIIKKSLLPNHPYSEDIERNYQDLQQKVALLEREKLEKRAALHKAERLAYLGRMATMMAHNMNQPIGVIRMETSGALSDINENLFDPTTELKPLLEKLLNQTERLSLIMGNFRSFSRGDRTVLSAVNLNSIIEDIYQLLFVAQYQLDRIELQKDFIASPIAHANEFAIQEMLISLLSNAREAVRDKSIKQIKIITWQENNQVGFCVEDNGDGIKEDDLPKLFTPFLSSKNEGMGLGLYFCREIAKDLGGSIEYYPAPLGGAGFKITLPIQQDNENGSAI